ncbi:MAG: hypothetical protein ACLFR1_05525 [Spirochaetia bacterium]
MSKKINKAYFLLPLLYLLVLFALLYFQFSQVRSFSYTDNGIVIEGTIPTSSNTTDSGVIDLTVGFHGVYFIFSPRSTLDFEMPDGSIYHASVQGISQEESRFTILFEGGTQIHVPTDSLETGQLILHPIIPAHLSEAQSVVMRFAMDSSLQTEEAQRLPLLRFSESTGQYYLSLSSGSIIDSDEGRLILVNRGGTFPEVVIDPSTEEDFLVYWFSKDGDTINAERFTRTIDQYLGRAYTGWRFNRYNPETGEWSVQGRDPVFSEDIIISVLAEALYREQFPSALSPIRRATRLHPGQLTEASSPYLGSVYEAQERTEQVTASRIREINEYLRINNSAVFQIHDLLHFAWLKAPEELRQELYSLADSVDIDNENLVTHIGLLQAFFTERNITNTEENRFSRFVDTIDSHILPAIIRGREGIFLLLPEEEYVDTKTSLWTGALLMDAADYLDRPVLESIGMRLITSILTLSDDSGFLPARLIMDSNRIEASQGFVPPEHIYSWIAPQRFYPENTELFQLPGGEAWVRTAAEINNIQEDDNSFVFNLTYAREGIHYMIFHNIEGLQGLQINGANWSPDTNFHRYTVSGYYYDPSSELLYIKLWHRQYEGRETLRLLF